jgi:hypothetical protein
VQHELLHGDLFRIQLAHHYGNVLEDADLRAARDPFLADTNGQALDEEVTELFGDSDSFGSFRLACARRSAGGVQLRFTCSDLPELTVLVAAPNRPEPCYRVAGRLRLSYLQLHDGRYPEPPLRGLFDVLTTKIMDRERDWLTLVLAE